MDPEFWHSKWKAGQIGFHEGEVNEHLETHSARLGTGKRVLVPLCGKAIDLTYLAAYGHQVIGVELVEQAAQEFFSQLGGTPTVTQQGAFKRYEQGSIAIFNGDFFATTKELLGPVDALYDRASLIALPENLRHAYMKHLRALLPAGAPGLVITVEYVQEVLAGPPFSVTDTELRAHYAGLSLEKLAERKAKGSPRLEQAGALEKCWAVTF
jgi:thiopurine S-methyltransferase